MIGEKKKKMKIRKIAKHHEILSIKIGWMLWTKKKCINIGRW